MVSFGAIVTMVAHFVYDLVLFGLFAAAGSAPEYRTTAAIIVLALLAPALAVAWRVVRQRGFVPLPDEARFAAWVPGARRPAASIDAVPSAHGLTSSARAAALVTGLAAAVLAVSMPPAPVLGRAFTATRAQVLAAADGELRARGGDPAGWRRLVSVATDTLDAWPRFLRANHIDSMAARFATSYVPPTWWTVRYVHTDSTTQARAEEWRVRIWPDGTRLDSRHVIPDSARRDSVSTAGARAIARAALARAGIDTAPLLEVNFDETARPLRRDVTVTYADSSVALPAGAAAHAWVTLAGNEPLVARRGVELPEAFLRADHDKQTTDIVIAGLCGLVLAILIGGGAVFVVRKRAVLLDDGALSVRSTVTIIGMLWVLGMAQSLNSLPQTLFAYDTTVPWRTFVATVGVGVVLTVFPALDRVCALAGGWSAEKAGRHPASRLPRRPTRRTTCSSPASDSAWRWL